MITWSKEYYKSQLPHQCQRYYDHLLSGFLSMKEHIIFPYPSVKADDISNALYAATLDHPEVFWVDGYDGYTCFSGPVYSTLRINNFFSNSDIPRWKSEAEMWRQRVCSQIPPSSDDYKKIWLLYDYLARQVTYGYSEMKYSQTIIGCLKKGFHRSVCEGIAKSFKYLCDHAGVNCIVIPGKLLVNGIYIGHAWNLVEYDQGIYHIDVTDALEYAKLYRKADDRRFLKPSGEMSGYIWDNSFKIP